MGHQQLAVRRPRRIVLVVGASLTRTVSFHARHRFYDPALGEAEHRARFGTLGDPPGHDHDYRCAVTVAGPLAAGRGMVMDLGDLDRILQEEVLDRLEGRHLNEVIPEFGYGRTFPTCEALAAHLFARLRTRLPRGVRLERVRIAEDATLHGDYTEAE